MFKGNLKPKQIVKYLILILNIVDFKLILLYPKYTNMFDLHVLKASLRYTVNDIFGTITTISVQVAKDLSPFALILKTNWFCLYLPQHFERLWNISKMYFFVKYHLQRHIVFFTRLGNFIVSLVIWCSIWKLFRKI